MEKCEKKTEPHIHTQGKCQDFRDLCVGKLMTVVYKKNNVWLKFIEENVYEMTLEEVQDMIFLKIKSQKKKAESSQ